MPVAAVNRTELYYEVHGAGPDLVFVHGENHGIEMFADQIEHFSTDHRCLTYYRRGHGRSGSPAYGYSMWNQTVDFEMLLDEVGVARPVVVAVAMSTPIAVTYAVHHPDRLRGLVLASWYELDGYPRLEERRRAKTPFPELYLAMQEIRERDGLPELERFMEASTSKEFPIMPADPELRARLIRMFVDHPPARFVQAAEYYSSIPYLVPDLRRVTCPVMGVCGDDDPSPDRPELVDGMSNFDQRWIADARRFPSVEKPDEFNAVLREFLERVSDEV
jgi:pimeloyl-ACP methyl ester carboxylesterase